MWVNALVLWSLPVLLACVFLLCRKVVCGRQAENSSVDSDCRNSHHVFRFRLKTLLALFVLFGAILATDRILWRDARHQSQLISRIHSYGGSVLYDFQYSPDTLRSNLVWKPASPPPDIVRVLGDDLWAEVVCVLFDSNPVTDSVLNSLIVDLEGLTELCYVRIMRPEFTRSGLEDLGKLRQLKILEINGEGLSEADSDKLQQLLPNCEILINRVRVVSPFGKLDP